MNWDDIEEEVERVRRGLVPEYRAIGMELVRKCLQCGHLVPVDEPLPECCPKCGAPETEFVSVIED